MRRQSGVLGTSLATLAAALVPVVSVRCMAPLTGPIARSAASRSCSAELAERYLDLCRDSSIR
jgi:hypothetical protein